MNIDRLSTMRAGTGAPPLPIDRSRASSPRSHYNYQLSTINYQLSNINRILPEFANCCKV
ncbi:MAG: hypothetical protein ACRC62_24160 [Microcoleus sp.]